MWIGIDTGGTFTDFVVYDGRNVTIHKVLSTPEAPEKAILTGISRLGINLENNSEELYVIHGSTVGTNAVLEGKGVRTAFITNRGLRDILSIGRQARRELYQLQPRLDPPPVPPELCLEVSSRISADGTELEPLTNEDLRQLRQAIETLAPQAVAINLLFSFLNERHEQTIEAIIPKEMFVSRSSKILPEYREYERGMATWLNAWIGPIMERYLFRLKDQLGTARISVMQSSGGTIDITQAGALAVNLLLSGPAGGLAGAQYIARYAGRDRLLTFDMGGTSTDVALVDGIIQLTNEGFVGPYPVAVPMVDMHTIGAGGGSIAYIDTGGLLQVGPRSAGANPGPACYGRGGVEATVTDANLVLGRLLPEAFLGGDMRLDDSAAKDAILSLANKLNLASEQAALGVIRVANEHMARALRVMSIQRGVDPREFTLVSFGGAGGLHVCALAESLKMKHAMVPINAGVLSALGMLVAPRSRQLSRTVTGLLSERDNQLLDGYFEELIIQGKEALIREGVDEDQIKTACSTDLRYCGQSYYLNIPWLGIDQSAASFHDDHALRYGHRLNQAVELVNVRVSLYGPTLPLRLANTGTKTTSTNIKMTRLFGVDQEVLVLAREQLSEGEFIQGPALLTEMVSTTYVAPNWNCTVDGIGNLLLEYID